MGLLFTGRALEKRGEENSTKTLYCPPQYEFFYGFLQFLDDFRKACKIKKQDNISIIVEAAGSRWKSMSESEKAPYLARAQEKIEFVKEADIFWTKQSVNDDEADDRSEVGGSGRQDYISMIVKAAGSRWKSLSESEKAPYVAREEEKIEFYNEADIYWKKQFVNDDEADDRGEVGGSGNAGES